MKILILCHSSLVPNQKLADRFYSFDITDNKIILKIESQKWRTEFFVADQLRQMGHEIRFCGLDNELGPLKRDLKSFAPDSVFNLLEEFSGEALLDYFVLTYLEREKVPYTGSRPEGLILSRNKLLTKKLLQHAGVPVPGEAFPKIVKCVSEDSSFGLTKQSIVYDLNQECIARKKLNQKLKMSGYRSRIFSETFLPGREVHVGVLGDQVFSPVEVTPDCADPNFFVTEKFKWDFSLRRRQRIDMRPAKFKNKKSIALVKSLALKAKEALLIDGPARVDFRLDLNENPYVIEVNANPDLARFDEFALSANLAQIKYGDIIQAAIENQ